MRRERAPFMIDPIRQSRRITTARQGDQKPRCTCDAPSENVDINYVANVHIFSGITLNMHNFVVVSVLCARNVGNVTQLYDIEQEDNRNVERAGYNNNSM
ncbi:hypothetical protein X777_10904 [Ooceraea biroi]|uniref:Uncharacterized protein n=1 Tax=Ooceraea biroi TaxID=2015173 RepID=A0A026W3E4_OOCBI|nr:hypothetical protein X777_10904 [Ooceraea biroi]